MAVAVKGTANTSATTTVTIPTHAIGDLIVLVAYKTSITAPTKPSASGTVPAWVTIDSVTGNSNSFLSSYFVATATNHTSGTWTGATSMVAIVLTGQSPAVIGGKGSGTNTSSLTVTGHTLTLTNADGSSAVLDFWARTATVTAWNAVTGFTDQATTTGTSALSLSTKDDSTAVAATNRVSTGTATTGANDQFEIVSGPHPTDSTVTSESLGLTNGPILYDPIDTFETVSLQCPSPLSVSDSTATSEAVTVQIASGPATLNVNVSDPVTTTSTGNAELQISFVNVSDSTATSETVALNLPGFTYSVNVSDSTSTSESKTVNPPSSSPQVSVSDSTTTSEWIVIALDPDIIFTLEVNVSDAAATSESTTVSLQPATTLNVNVNDTATTNSTGNLQTLVSFINKSDSTATSESVSVVLPVAGNLTISVSDNVAHSETTNLAGIVYRPAVTDSTSTADSVSVQLQPAGQPPNTHPPLGGTFDTNTSGGTFNGGASGGSITSTNRGGNVTFTGPGGTPNTGSSGGTIKKPTRGGIVQLPAAGGDIE